MVVRGKVLILFIVASLQLSELKHRGQKLDQQGQPLGLRQAIYLPLFLLLSFLLLFIKQVRGDSKPFV